jgi:hypothetical protein
VISGHSVVLSASAAAEEAATVSLSVPVDGGRLHHDARYGIVPFTIYGGYGKGGGFADITLNYSGSFGYADMVIPFP